LHLLEGDLDAQHQGHQEKEIAVLLCETRGNMTLMQLAMSTVRDLPSDDSNTFIRMLVENGADCSDTGCDPYQLRRFLSSNQGMHIPHPLPDVSVLDAMAE